jgi:hypothetical protein
MKYKFENYTLYAEPRVLDLLQTGPQLILVDECYEEDGEIGIPLSMPGHVGVCRQLTVAPLYRLEDRSAEQHFMHDVIGHQEYG